MLAGLFGPVWRGMASEPREDVNLAHRRILSDRGEPG